MCVCVCVRVCVCVCVCVCVISLSVYTLTIIRFVHQKCSNYPPLSYSEWRENPLSVTERMADRSNIFPDERRRGRYIHAFIYRDLIATRIAVRKEID